MLPKRFPDREAIAAVRGAAERAEPGQTLDEEHRVAGRVMARREMGKLTFLDLVDRSGRIQLLCDTSRTGPIDVDLGDIVGVTGSPARAKRGEPSIAVDELELLAKIQRPLPDTFHGVTDVETRYRQRYLDLLMNEETRADFELRTRIVAAVRRHLDEAVGVEVAADRGHELRADREVLAGLLVHQQVEVPLPVARLDVRDAVEGVRQRPPDLRQKLELADCEARFAAPGAGRRPGHAHDVTEVDVDLAGATGVAEKLDPAGAVDEVEEDELPHLAAGHDTAGEPALLARLVSRLEPLCFGTDCGDLVAVGEALGEAHRRASLTGLPL